MAYKLYLIKMFSVYVITHVPVFIITPIPAEHCCIQQLFSCFNFVS